MTTDRATPDTHAPTAPTQRPTGIGPSEVVLLPIDALDFDDTAWMFRASLRTGPLERSIRLQGQQVPIVVRPSSQADTWQIVSGFRRATAMRNLGLTHVAGIVRMDLQEDEAAFKASVLENTARKTYSDIDRALVIRGFERSGYRSVQVADLMGLTKRQKNKLKSLLDLPEVVQQAVDDPDGRFATRHALLLKQLQGRYPALQWAPWIEAVNGEELSVAQLTRRVNATYRSAEEGFTSLFRANDTDLDEGVVRFQPVKVRISELSEEEKKALRLELEALLARL